VRRTVWLLVLSACLAAAMIGPWLVTPAGGGQSKPAHPVRRVITYTAWNGSTRQAVLLLPAGYTPARAGRLPLIISPHGRGMSDRSIASCWGCLPTLDHFAVVCPAGEGVRLPNYSWAAPGQIADLARMPEIVERAVPWVRIDARRVYAVGPSMGGQEALVLAAEYPDRIAAAASIDGLADLTTRFYEMPRSHRTGRHIMHDMVVECGGTPARRPLAYALRSPLSYAANLAFDRVPIELWWSRCDQVVVDQASHQSGLLYRVIKRLNPAAPVRQIVTDEPHCAAFCPGIALGRVVTFLRPNGRWRHVPARPPRDWLLRSGSSCASFWRYRFRTTDPLHGFWEVRRTATREIVVQTPVPMTLTLPCSATRHFARVMIGRALHRETVRDGSIHLALPPGRRRLLVL